MRDGRGATCIETVTLAALVLLVCAAGLYLYNRTLWREVTRYVAARQGDGNDQTRD